MPIDTAELRQATTVCSKLPWKCIYDESDDSLRLESADGHTIARNDIDDEIDLTNLCAVAALVNALPALLDAHDAKTAEINRLRRQHIVDMSMFRLSESPALRKAWIESIEAEGGIDPNVSRDDLEHYIKGFEASEVERLTAENATLRKWQAEAREVAREALDWFRDGDYTNWEDGEPGVVDRLRALAEGKEGE